MVYFYGVSFTALQIEARLHRRHPADDFMALFVQESDSSIFSHFIGRAFIKWA